MQAICGLPLDYAPRSRAIYSDLGFILLGSLVARDSSLEDRFSAFWPQVGSGEELQFRPPVSGGAAWPRPRSTRGAGDCWWAKCTTKTASRWAAWRDTRGFSERLSAVGVFARHVLQVLEGRTGAFSPASAIEFTTRRADVPRSSRALGWDTMLPTSSCGTLMSARAFGHTGFTGTSLWLDPEAGCYVVLLSNRVHPSREGDGMTDCRPAFHDAVMEEWSRR